METKIVVVLLAVVWRSAVAVAVAEEGSKLVPSRREVYDEGRIYDISHRYHPDMPSWESNDGIGQFLWLQTSIKNGSFANISQMKILTHTGTHVDAPAHFFDHYFDAGFDVDSLDLLILNGPALLVDVPRDSNITAQVMKSLNIPRGVIRVLFRTLNTERRLMFKKECDTSYVGFTVDGAEWLVENTDIKLVGTDYLSVAYDDLVLSHHVFLRDRVHTTAVGAQDPEAILLPFVDKEDHLARPTSLSGNNTVTISGVCMFRARQEGCSK